MRKLLFFDLEWVPIKKDFETLQKEMPEYAEAWERRCKKWKAFGKFGPDETPAEIFEKEAGFFAEYIKIICATFGFFNSEGELQLKSFFGDNEKEILQKVHKLLTNVSGTFDLAGHGIKRYDMPFLAKRMLINDLPVPDILNNGPKKPWEITAVDLAEEWRFGCQYEPFTPVDWICVSLKIDTPKDDISGADVKRVYYEEENGLEKIVKYCEKDVVATAKAIQKLFNMTGRGGFLNT